MVWRVGFVFVAPWFVEVFFMEWSFLIVVLVADRLPGVIVGVSGREWGLSWGLPGEYIPTTPELGKWGLYSHYPGGEWGSIFPEPGEWGL